MVKMSEKVASREQLSEVVVDEKSIESNLTNSLIGDIQIIK